MLEQSFNAAAKRRSAAAVKGGVKVWGKEHEPPWKQQTQQEKECIVTAQVQETGQVSLPTLIHIFVACAIG